MEMPACVPLVFRSYSACIPLIFRLYSICISLALLWGLPPRCGVSIKPAPRIGSVGVAVIHTNSHFSIKV